jgi:hypothetical protein
LSVNHKTASVARSVALAGNIRAATATTSGPPVANQPWITPAASNTAVAIGGRSGAAVAAVAAGRASRASSRSATAITRIAKPSLARSAVTASASAVPPAMPTAIAGMIRRASAPPATARRWRVARYADSSRLSGRNTASTVAIGQRVAPSDTASTVPPKPATASTKKPAASIAARSASSGYDSAGNAASSHRRRPRAIAASGYTARDVDRPLARQRRRDRRLGLHRR